ncbi:hypothetical protein CKO44_18225 [Rubrivivax gelatinosus]|uniref:integrase n=1 Tax=Rubrivivax gelatinosus TaxID=28068 RepID=UPI00190417B5|nr:integrase [Rubrivivax gelatinosus]MBK1615400.1 hypothetical protein [Rubrivivax gelatinosus]MBZ8143039.1 integrase [Rubrivivax gelatinosus]
MTKDPALPARVFTKGACYYLVVADGKKRVWNKLSKLSDGLPAMYMALAKMLSTEDRDGSMTQLIADWQAEVMAKHSAKTQIDERARGAKIAARFADFQVSDVTPPDVVEFLKPFRGKPRTFNLYRALIGELMRFAIEKGLRAPGTNPVTSVVRTMSTPARKRCPTTSEIRRVKIGCLYGDDKKLTRSGLTMACLIELAYLTGQDVSVMIRLRDQLDPRQPDEPHVRSDGVFFRRDKTGNAVLVEWTPRLRAVVAALQRVRAERRLKKQASLKFDTALLFTRQSGEPLTYSAVANAWQEGIRRSKVLPFMFRDIRARALTDTALRDGIRAANAMGAHTTEAQTADYVRSKTARKTKATA